MSKHSEPKMSKYFPQQRLRLGFQSVSNRGGCKFWRAQMAVARRLPDRLPGGCPVCCPVGCLVVVVGVYVGLMIWPIGVHCQTQMTGPNMG